MSFPGFEINIDRPCDEHRHSQSLETKTIRIRKPEQRFNPRSPPVHFGPMSEVKRTDGRADITIKFGSETFRVHKKVLKSASEFFEEDVLASSPSILEFDLAAANTVPKRCKAPTIKKLIDFAYTGALPFNANVILSTLEAAVALSFHEAIDILKRYMHDFFKHEHLEIPVATLGGVLSLCQKSRRPLSKEHLDELFDDACKYLAKQPLGGLAANAGFLKALSPDGVVAFLGGDDLAKAHDEDKVLSFALTWLNHDWDKCQKYAKKVLDKVRLGLVSRAHLTTLLSELEGDDNCVIAECKKMVEEVLRLLDTKKDAAVPLEYSHPHWFSARSTMIVNTLIAIGPGGFFGGQVMAYFNAYGKLKKKRQGWQNFCDFEPIPAGQEGDGDPAYRSAVLVVDNKLLVAGGYHYRMSYCPDDRTHMLKWGHDGFYQGSIGQSGMQFGDQGGFLTINVVNPWTELPSMKDTRHSFPMVHLGDYVYAIGGVDEGGFAIKKSERYNLRSKKWEKIADMPLQCYHTCAVVYKGKVLVYGSQPVLDSDTPAQHNLLMYDPATKKWQDLLTEQHTILKFKKVKVDPPEGSKGKKRKHQDGEDDEDGSGTDVEEYESDDGKSENAEVALLPMNALVVVGDDCYRVVYTVAKRRRSSSEEKKLQPQVHQLEFNDAMSSVKVGKPQDQKLLPRTAEGSFQIDDNVFVNMKGCVHNTGIKIAPDQKDVVELGVWKKLHGKEIKMDELTIANFTFDKKKAFCKECVEGKTCCNMERYGEESSSGSDCD